MIPAVRSSRFKYEIQIPIQKAVVREFLPNKAVNRSGGQPVFCYSEVAGRHPVTYGVRLGGSMDEEIAEIVRQYGWYAASVNDAEPPFLYSIGLMETYKHPEFIIFGLDSNNAYALISGLIADIQRGQTYSENGVRTIELGGDKHQVGFRRVHPTQHPLYLGFAMGFLTNGGRIGELNAMQAFWPDEKGRFPFDTGCDIGVYNLQPRLDIGLTPREVRAFERRWG